jgi:hypothetical protein
VDDSQTEDPPASAPPELPAPVDSAPAARDQQRDTTPGPLGNLVAAHFQRVEIALLARVLTTTLVGALPPRMVRVQRRRTLIERLLRRPGETVGISVIADDQILTLRAPELGVTETTIGHIVRGVVLSSDRVPVATWLATLADTLNRVTNDDAVTRAALERALLR